MGSDLLANIPADVDAQLRSFGWFPARRVNTCRAENIFAQQGFAISPTNLALIRSLGELYIRYPHFVDVSIKDDLNIDLQDTARHTTPAMLTNYECIAGGPLLPIGSACRDNMTAALADDGRLFFAMGDMLIEFGPDICTGLTSLLRGTGRKVWSIENNRFVLE